MSMFDMIPMILGQEAQVAENHAALEDVLPRDHTNLRYFPHIWSE